MVARMLWLHVTLGSSLQQHSQNFATDSTTHWALLRSYLSMQTAMERRPCGNMVLLPITCKYSSSMKMREAHSPQLPCYGSFATTSNSIASAISTSLPAPTSKFSTAALCKDAMTSCETRIKSTPNVVGMWTNHDSSDSGAKTRSGRRACSFQKMPRINLVCQLCYVYVDVSAWEHPVKMCRTSNLKL